MQSLRTISMWSHRCIVGLFTFFPGEIIRLHRIHLSPGLNNVGWCAVYQMVLVRETTRRRYQSINKSTDQSINQSINRSVGRSVSQSVNVCNASQSVSQSINQSINTSLMSFANII